MKYIAIVVLLLISAHFSPLSASDQAGPANGSAHEGSGSNHPLEGQLRDVLSSYGVSPHMIEYVVSRVLPGVSNETYFFSDFDRDFSIRFENFLTEYGTTLGFVVTCWGCFFGQGEGGGSASSFELARSAFEATRRVVGNVSGSHNIQIDMNLLGSVVSHINADVAGLHGTIQSSLSSYMDKVKSSGQSMVAAMAWSLSVQYENIAGNYHKGAALESSRDDLSSIFQDEAKSVEELGADIESKLASSNQALSAQLESLQGEVDRTQDLLDNLTDDMISDLEHELASSILVYPFETPVHSVEGQKLLGALNYKSYVEKKVAESPMSSQSKLESQQLIDLAGVGLETADSFYNDNRIEEGDAAVSMAEVALDVALSLIPGIGWGKDLYEVVTGRNLVTGQQLSKMDYTFAVLGSVTFGFGSKIKHGAKGIDAGLDVISAAARKGGIFADSGRVADGVADSRKIVASAKKPAREFEAGIARLPPGERVAIVKQVAQVKASLLGWIKNSRLSSRNKRDIYVDKKGTPWGLDTQHGRWEKFNKRSGRHEGEFNFDLEKVKPAVPGRNIIL